MDIRKFYLQDAAGVRLDLNGADGIWAVDPSGLGVELSPVYGDLGWGFFTELDARTRPMRRPGLRIVFTRRETNYAQYREFARFVATAGTGLLLVYEPYAGAVFYRQVRLRALTKGERNRVGWLEIPMEVNALTPWFLPYDVRFELSSLEGALRYDVGRFDSGGVFTNTQAGEFGAAVQP